MAWGVMYNGAWDYPAEYAAWLARGELPRSGAQHCVTGHSATESWPSPKWANGQQFDRRLFRDHWPGMGSRAALVAARIASGAIRLLGYDNRSTGRQLCRSASSRPRAQTGTHSGRHFLTRRVGALKYGTGVSFDQAITKDFGFFVRLGWNDGKTESWAFTSIDRLAGGGVSLKGTRWKRKDDVVATSLTAGGLSAVQPRVSGGWWPRFSDRRRRAQLRAGIRVGKLLLGAHRAGLLRRFRRPARYQPCL